MKNMDLFVIKRKDLEKSIQDFERSLLASEAADEPDGLVSLPDAVKAAKDWVASAEDALAFGMPVPSPAFVVSSLSRFAKEQWRPQ